MIAKINLLLKYPTVEFAPQIFCGDYLRDAAPGASSPIFQQKFDYIAPNPPWGAANASATRRNSAREETFSSFFRQAFEQLAPLGTVRFLFPEAILNVKAHRWISHFILNAMKLRQITLYNELFSDVSTKYVDLECGAQGDNDAFLVTKRVASTRSSHSGAFTKRKT